MKPGLPRWALALSLSSLPLLTGTAQANPVVPAADSPTVVTREGEQFTITGGVTSADGQALLHSFQQLGLSAEQVATFVATPEIQAILGRVSSGEASYIDGLLQVVGSSADLYLINPAGILLGPNTRLDLSGSFAATTASGVQFGDDVLAAVGPHTFSEMVGLPTGYRFGEQAGAIVNTGNLAVVPGASITLLGGQVISTGTLTAPGGTLTIAAIPDANLVRISHADMLLNLELATLPAATVPGLPWTPLSLPALLTGGEVAIANSLTVTPTGTIRLINTATEVAAVAGNALVSGRLDTAGPSGGSITVVGDRVALLGATLEASGAQGGGTVRLGGDFQGQPTLPRASLTYVDAATAIAANGGLTGDGGTVILWSEGTTGFWGEIQARGGITAGDGGLVEVSGAATLIFRGDVTTAAPQGQVGQLLLDPVNIVIRDGTADGDDTDLLATALSEPEVPLIADRPTTIFESELESLTGNTALTLRASQDIILEDLTDNALTFQSRLTLNPTNIPGFVLPDPIPADPAPIRFEAGGAFVMAAGDAIVAPGRDLIIQAGGPVTVGTLETWRNGNDPANVPLGETPDGSITLVGASITGGLLNALQVLPVTGLGRGNISRIYLESTAGDIVVGSLMAGGGGVIVNAAGRFRALDRISVRENVNGNASDPVSTPSILAAIDNRIPLADPNAVPPFTAIEIPVVVQRGTAIAPDAPPGIWIALDLSNRLGPTDVTFATNVEAFLSPELSGTVDQILHVRPDRVVLTRLENQSFLFESTVDPTTVTNLLNLDEATPALPSGEEEAAGESLEICDENAAEPSDRCAAE